MKTIPIALAPQYSGAGSTLAVCLKVTRVDGTVIGNVAAGALTSTSTEAVNGAQLFATNTQVGLNTDAIADIALGLGILVRRWTPWAALGMIVVTLAYLAAATLTLPHYWLDPLGPWLKVIPAMILCLFVMATEARR